jgi:putative membrane protein
LRRIKEADMFDRLPTVAVIFALLAAAIHVLFFVLESVLFRRPFAWRTFGIRTQQDPETTRDWALNQGFYNLFLAIGVVAGVLLQVSGDPATVAGGVGMVLLGTGSMVGAAVVLLVTKPALLRGAAIQGIAPLLAIAGLLIF